MISVCVWSSFSYSDDSFSGLAPCLVMASILSLFVVVSGTNYSFCSRHYLNGNDNRFGGSRYGVVAEAGWRGSLVPSFPNLCSGEWRRKRKAWLTMA